MSEAGNFEGSLDGVAGYDITGWAWRPQTPTEPAIIEVVLGRRVIATGKADRYRGDLADAGKRGGHCAFRIAVGRLGLDGAAKVDVRSQGVVLGQVELAAEHVALANAYAARIPASEDATVDPGEIPPHPPTKLPVRLGGPAGITGWIDRFDETGVGGWAYDPDGDGKPLRLRVMFAKDTVGWIDANGWREDLAEMRQGDGRVGIDAPAPVRLLDGRPRAIDIRLGEKGPSVLDGPLVVQCAPVLEMKAAPAPAPLRRKRLIPGPVEISFIVLFYNMRREAERTLTSLSRAYQRGIEDVEYEVICVDNGSKVPLEAEWIESFGPEFRLMKPSAVKPSPVFAMNEAARTAKGKRLALMIDGAHVVTPGLIREAMDAFRETPEAVVGLRQWFFGGDQRWFSQVGYTREHEDIVFGKIGWPKDGYRLFEVSSPMMPTPSPWFDSASESNCTILPKTLFEKIGGYDEGFDIPGGGLANLDLFTKAVETPGVTAIMLLGEASFHQFHGGTTTNIEEEKKNAEVRRYKNDFSRWRGERLRHLMADRIRFRGHMPTPEATVTRQRPVVRGFTGVTDKVRPTDAYLYFDDGAKDYLNGYAVEAGVPEQTRWMGKPTGLAAGDLVNLQEIMGNVRPTRIVAVNAREGLKLYLQSLLKLFDIADAQLVLAGGAGDPIPGPARSAATLQRVREAVGLADDVLVIFRPDADDLVPIEAVSAYGELVSRLSYLIVAGTTSGQPWLGYSTRWVRKAAQMLAASGQFRIDPSFEFHLVTACSWGYLRRTGGRQDQDDGEYDARLDDLSAL